MEKRSFYYEVQPELALTGADFALLYKVGHQHYDVRCKSTVLPGSDGFIHGWAHHWIFNHASEPIGFSLDEKIKLFEANPEKEYVTYAQSFQIDTMLKMMEMSVHLPDEADKKAGVKLHADLGLLMREMMRETKRMNEKNISGGLRVERAKHE